MSYGKYGFRGGVPKFNNEVTNAAYNDPWFAAGMLAAQAWNKNYEDRGVRKFIEAEDAKKREKAYAQQQAAQQAQQRAEFINSSGNAQNPAFDIWLDPNAGKANNPSAENIQGTPLNDIIAKHIAGQGSAPTGDSEKPEATGTLNPIVANQQGMEQTPTPQQQTTQLATPQMQSSQGGNAVDPAIQDFVMQAQKAGIIPSYNTQGVLPMNNQQPSITNSLDLKKKDGSDEVVEKSVLAPIVEDKKGNEEKTEGATSNNTGDPAVQQLVAAGKQAGIIKDFQPQSFGQEQLQQAIGKMPADKGKVLSSVQAPVPAQAKSVLNALAYAQPSVDTSFNKDTYLAGIKKDMTKRGFSDERQETILAALMPEAERRQKEVDDVKIKELVARIPGLNLENGYNPEIFGLIAEMAKANPQMADLLVKNMVTARDGYGVKVKREDAIFSNELDKNNAIFKSDLELQNYIRKSPYIRDNMRKELSDRLEFSTATERAKHNYTIGMLMNAGLSPEEAILRTLGGGGKGNSNPRNEQGFVRYELANKIIEADAKRRAEDPNYKTDPQNQNRINWAKSYIQAFEEREFMDGNQASQGQNKQQAENQVVPNLHNYDEAMDYFGEAQAELRTRNRLDPQGFVQLIRDKYNLAPDERNEFVEAIMNSLGYGAYIPRTEEEIAAEKAQKEAEKEAQIIATRENQAQERKKGLEKGMVINPYSGKPVRSPQNIYLGNPNK